MINIGLPSFSRIVSLVSYRQYPTYNHRTGIHHLQASMMCMIQCWTPNPLKQCEAVVELSPFQMMPRQFSWPEAFPSMFLAAYSTMNIKTYFLCFVNMRLGGVNICDFEHSHQMGLYYWFTLLKCVNVDNLAVFGVIYTSVFISIQIQLSNISIEFRALICMKYQYDYPANLLALK